MNEKACYSLEKEIAPLLATYNSENHDDIQISASHGQNAGKCTVPQSTLQKGKQCPWICKFRKCKRCLKSLKPHEEVICLPIEKSNCASNDVVWCGEC